MMYMVNCDQSGWVRCICSDVDMGRAREFSGHVTSAVRSVHANVHSAGPKQTLALHLTLLIFAAKRRAAAASIYKEFPDTLHSFVICAKHKPDSELTTYSHKPANGHGSSGVL